MLELLFLAVGMVLFARLDEKFTTELTAVDTTSTLTASKTTTLLTASKTTTVLTEIWP